MNKWAGVSLQVVPGLLIPPVIGGAIGFFRGIPSLDTPAVGWNGSLMGALIFATVFSTTTVAIILIAKLARSWSVIMLGIACALLEWLQCCLAFGRAG